jgi:arginase family enzyme
MAALDAWARSVSTEVDGLYIAIDHDVLDADEGAWSLTMPESGGLSIAIAVEAVHTLAAAIPVAGYGATTLNFDHGDGDRTLDAAARLAATALA